MLCMDQFYDKEVVERTAAFVRSRIRKSREAASWACTDRIWKTASRLARAENAWEFVVELAALLRELALLNANAPKSKQLAIKTTKDWLKSLKVSPKVIGAVCQIIEKTTFAPRTRVVHTPESVLLLRAIRLEKIAAATRHRPMLRKKV